MGKRKSNRNGEKGEKSLIETNNQNDSEKLKRKKLFDKAVVPKPGEKKKKKKLLKKVKATSKGKGPESKTTASVKNKVSKTKKKYRPKNCHWQEYSQPNIAEQRDISMDYKEQNIEGDPSYNSFSENDFGVLPFNWENRGGNRRNFSSQNTRERIWHEGSSFKDDRTPMNFYDNYNKTSPGRNFSYHKRQPEKCMNYREQNVYNYNNNQKNYSTYKKVNKQFKNFHSNDKSQQSRPSSISSVASYNERFDGDKISPLMQNRYLPPSKTFEIKPKSSLSLSDSVTSQSTDEVRKDQLKLSLKASEIIDNILKGGTGKVQKHSEPCEANKDREDKRSSPLQSSKVCSSSKDFTNSRSTTSTSSIRSSVNTGSYLLDRAERLCKQLRDKRELSKGKTEKDTKAVRENSLLGEPPPLQRSGVPHWLASIDLIGTAKSDFKDSSKVVSSTSEVEKCKTLSSPDISKMTLHPLNTSEKPLSRQSSLGDSNLMLQTSDSTLKVHSHKNHLSAKVSPRCRSLSESSDKNKKGKRLDKDSISKLVNSPRSRKDRMQVLKFLKVYTKQQQKQRPKLSLVSPHQEEPDVDDQYMQFDDLPEDIQNQVKELIEGESEQDISNIINLVDDDDDSDHSLEKQYIVRSEVENIFGISTESKVQPLSNVPIGKIDDHPLTLHDLTGNADSSDPTVLNDSKDTTENENQDKIKESVNAYMSSSYVKSLAASVINLNQDDTVDEKNMELTNEPKEGDLQQHVTTQPTRLIEIVPDPDYQSNESTHVNKASSQTQASVHTVRGSENMDVNLYNGDLSMEYELDKTPNRQVIIKPTINETIEDWECRMDEDIATAFLKTSESHRQSDNGSTCSTDMLSREESQQNYSDAEHLTRGEENDINKDYMTRIYELSLKENMVREKKGQVDIEIKELQNLLEKTQEQLKHKEHLRNQFVNEEEILRSKRMRLLKGAVERKSCNTRETSQSVNVQSSSACSELSRLVCAQRNGFSDTVHSPDANHPYTTGNLNSQQRTLYNENYSVDVTENNLSQDPLVSQINVVPVDLDSTVNNETLAQGMLTPESDKIASSNREPDSTEIQSKVLPQITAIPDSTCGFDDSNEVVNISENNKDSTNMTKSQSGGQDGGNKSGATIKYMGSFSLPDIDNTVLQSLVKNYSEINTYSELKQRPYVLIDNQSVKSKDGTNSNVEFEADEEEQIEEEEESDKQKTKKSKKRKNNKNRVVLVSSESSSSSEQDNYIVTQTNGSSPSRKVRKKVNASPTAKLLKEYLHAESSTDVEINGLEPKSKARLCKKNKKYY